MWIRVLWRVSALLVLAAGAGVAYLYFRRPAMAPAGAGRIEPTPARLARGRYLFEHLCDCGGCHSPRDFSRFNGPEVVSKRGQGMILPAEMGFPGRVVAPNITPDRDTGIGAWTDGEKVRAIRDGVGPDGRALFPYMPYPFFRHMCDEDARSLVAYLNTLPPIRNPLPRSQIRFPVNLLIQSVPRPAGSVAAPDPTDLVQYGEYLVRMAGCIDCHTPMQRGRPQLDRLLAGGREFRMPYGLVVSANITPDDSGIGSWGERQFKDKFAEYRDYARNGPPKVGRFGFTLMPWLNFSGLAEEDLGAIFAYLKTQRPVRNHVETHPGAPAADN